MGEGRNTREAPYIPRTSPQPLRVFPCLKGRNMEHDNEAAQKRQRAHAQARYESDLARVLDTVATGSQALAGDGQAHDPLVPHVEHTTGPTRRARGLPRELTARPRKRGVASPPHGQPVRPKRNRPRLRGALQATLDVDLQLPPAGTLAGLRTLGVPDAWVPLPNRPLILKDGRRRRITRWVFESVSQSRRID